MSDPSRPVRIGTRGSALALTQSNWVKRQIEAAHPHLRVELVKIKTTGDKITDVPLARVGGKGLFVKEIEEALLDGRVDLAVHSMKDVPAELPAELHIGVTTEREDARDALISAGGVPLAELPQGARVGTSSLRRRAQLLAVRPDLTIVPLRGNLDTRLRKLDDGELQAILLASAGLRRLGLAERITQALDYSLMLPAIGQGALGLELRKDDDATLGLIRFLNHEATEVAVRAERVLLARLQGGCQVPIAALGRLDGEENNLRLDALVADLEGRRIVRASATDTPANAVQLGLRVADELLAQGAGEILAEIYGGAAQAPAGA
ncbi:MAG: hydroxymethylbilane synthase [Pseudomonadota bacterium]